MIRCLWIGLTLLVIAPPASRMTAAPLDEIDEAEMKLILAAEQARVEAIRRVRGSVVAIYGEIRGGGGSGVIFDPSGLVLTNHHVVAGAGVSGWAGIADGNLYRWKLVGTDPGGDVAIIRLEGKDVFPHAPLGDSDKVRVGDWAIAMGNPFVLTEDQKPTVTLGIVSGVERYQPGAGGGNQLVYGNCIQVDSSINPGNSGGPLFNMQGEVIGINGRGSFKDRGRVNVGLGYAISANQIKNFIGDLMATKLVEHGTLDVRFAERNGKVVCEAMYNEGVAIVEKGLELGDELLEFEGYPIRSNDQFTNLVSTLPENWPAHVVFKKSDGTIKDVHVRLVGLPYDIKPPRAAPPRPPQGKTPGKPDDKKKPQEPTPEQKRAMERNQEMVKVMTTKAGTIRDEAMNRENCQIVVDHLVRSVAPSTNLLTNRTLVVTDTLLNERQERIGSQNIWIAGDGRFRIHIDDEGFKKQYVFDGQDFWKLTDGSEPEKLTYLKARLTPEIVQVIAYASLLQPRPYELFGKLLLDGSDKSRNQPAFRLKTIDASNDWFYIWATIFDETGHLDVKLSKASADLNADGNSGGVVYQDWRSIDGLAFPHRREFVKGLAETVEEVAVTESIEMSPGIHEPSFRVNPADKQKP